MHCWSKVRIKEIIILNHLEGAVQLHKWKTKRNWNELIKRMTIIQQDIIDGYKSFYLQTQDSMCKLECDKFFKISFKNKVVLNYTPIFTQHKCLLELSKIELISWTGPSESRKLFSHQKSVRIHLKHFLITLLHVIKSFWESNWKIKFVVFSHRKFVYRIWLISCRFEKELFVFSSYQP